MTHRFALAVRYIPNFDLAVAVVLDGLQPWEVGNPDESEAIEWYWLFPGEALVFLCQASYTDVGGTVLCVACGFNVEGEAEMIIGEVSAYTFSRGQESEAALVVFEG